MKRRPPLKEQVLRALLVVWLLLCVAMAALAYVRHTHPDSPWARWQVEAARAEAAHLKRLQEQGERDYIQFTQRLCGPETGWLARADGARDCTTKHGRRTGQLLAGANP